LVDGVWVGVAVAGTGVWVGVAVAGGAVAVAVATIWVGVWVGNWVGVAVSPGRNELMVGAGGLA
jgi:hypothetical protein